MQSKQDSESLALSEKYCIDIKNVPLIFVVYVPFRINTENLIKNKLYICKEYNIQFSEINKLPFYEFEILLEEIKAIQKKHKEDEEKQNKGFNPSNYGKSLQNSVNNFKMPKVNVPKI